MIGLLRVKNEARWIDRVVRSIQPVCGLIIVLDDHSTDGTPEICESLGCKVYRSGFDGIDEARDKDELLKTAIENGARPGDWCLMIDGDEMLHPDDVGILRDSLASARMLGYSLPIKYLWDSEDKIRVDGVYRKFRRPSVFRLVDKPLTFRRTGFGGHLHCSSVPAHYIGCAISNEIPARLLHFGYLHREDRIRKYHWYRSIDPNNQVEDGYRHMVIGDLFPATAAFRWGGPLELQAI